MATNRPYPPPPPPPPGLLKPTTTFRDLTAQLELTDDFCRRQLTKYEMFTMRKYNLRDVPGIKKDRETKRNTKRDKKGSKRFDRPESNWLRIQMTEEVFEQEDISKNIQALDKKRSVISKKANLSTNPSRHVDNLLVEKNRFENDQAFTWTLRQLDEVTTRKSSNKKKTEAYVLYLKRAPRGDVDPKVVYRNLDSAKAGRPFPQQQHQPLQQLQQLQLQQQYSNGPPPQRNPGNGAGHGQARILPGRFHSADI
jgi:hypothetical protein